MKANGVLCASVALLLAACSSQSEPVSDANAPAASSPTLDRAPLDLAERMSLRQISDSLAAMPRLVKPVEAAAGSVIVSAERNDEHLVGQDYAVGPDGLLHCIFSAAAFRGDKTPQLNEKPARSGLYYLRQTASGWTSPELVTDDRGMDWSSRILVDSRGTVHVLYSSYGKFSPSDARGKVSRDMSILHTTRLPDGVWSAAKTCVGPERGVTTSFDVCLDGNDVIHLASLGRTKRDLPPELYCVSTINAQQYRNGQWSAPQEAAKVENRKLSHLHLTCGPGRLHLQATAQTPDYSIIGTYACIPETNCPRMELVQDSTAFESAVSSNPPAAKLIGAMAYPGQYADPSRQRCVLFALGARGAARRVGKAFAFGDRPIMCFSGWDGGDTPSLDVDDSGRPYLLSEQSGNIFLLRLGNGGKTEAVCLYAARRNDSRAAKARLFIRGGRITALWTVAEQYRLQDIHCWRGPIPNSGWLDADQMLWRSRAGLGLSRADWRVLADSVLGQGRAAERAGDISCAIDRYIYVLLNPHKEFSQDATERAGVRLSSMVQAGVTEVRRRLAKYDMCHSDERNAHMPANSAIIEHLIIDPNDLPRLVALPSQNAETMHRLLRQWDWEPFDVPMPSGNVVRVWPERIAFARATMITREEFRDECMKRLPQQPEEHLGWVTFPAGPQIDGHMISRHLDDLANWQVRPTERKGEKMEGWLDGKKLQEMTDKTFADAGGVGLWSKADAATSFDDFATAPPLPAANP